MSIINSFQKGQQVRVRLPLIDAGVRQTNTKPPKLFLDATFTDGPETISGKIWNWPEKATVPETKKCYDIVGSVSEFNGTLQLTLLSMSLSENQDVSEFSLDFGLDTSMLYEQAAQLIRSISNEKLRKITDYIYWSNISAICNSTSAISVHHMGIGGNLLHSIEVAKTAIATGAIYPDADIKVDLLCAGALLHDIGKLPTYIMDGPYIEYTMDGNLLDHITLGILMLADAGKALAADGIDVTVEIKLLQHIIASHHGQLEWGSPVTPKFVEAWLIHFADRISATVDTLARENIKSSDSIYTAKVFACGNRPHLKQKLINDILGQDTV